MTFFKSIGLAILTAIGGLLGATTVAALAASWYRISSFEGGAGFFVVGMALVGLMAGFIVGLIVSRVEATRTPPKFSHALATSSGVVGGILAVIAGTSWMLADIPPQIDGEELFMLTEIRWPLSGAPAPTALEDAPYLRLGASSGSVVRRMENGPVFTEDARQEDGRWIVAGALPIFTTRGQRVLDFGAGDKTIAGFIVPLPRHPGEAQRQWSAWLPMARPGEPALPDQFTYRFKVIRRSEPVRTETVGRFEIDTIADYFHNVVESDRLAARSTFTVKYGGQPVPGVTTAENVAVVGGSRPTIFVKLEHSESGVPCVLLVDNGGAARLLPVTGCGSLVAVRRLTSDQASLVSRRSQTPLPGWIDRMSFREPGLYQFDAAIVDTRNLTSAEFQLSADSRPDTSVPPLGLSPDEQSFVWFAQGPEESPRLGVTNWRLSQSYLLPIDKVRMRFNAPASLDIDWVQYHFEWKRGGDGVDVLAERPDFEPLPFHGDLTLGKPGEFQSYTLRPGGDQLRDAIVELLVRDLGGVREKETYDFRRSVRVDGRLLSVSVIGTPSYVHVTMDTNSDPDAMAAIAKRLDAALATRQYDALFVAQQ